MGWAQDQAALLHQEGIKDRWQVLGQVSTSEGNLKAQRTWLRGEQNQKIALVLDFAYGGKPTESGLVVNTVFEGELVFYAGNAPQRGLVKGKIEAEPLKRFDAQESILSATEAYARALACQPWLERYPMLLSQVVPVPDGDRWHLVDASHRLSVHPDFQNSWKLLAISGGRPLTLFGEWDGHHYLPLSASSAGETFRLHT